MDLLAEALGAIAAAAEDAEPAPVGDGGGQFGGGDGPDDAARDGAHAREEEGVFDAEQVAEGGAEDGTGHRALQRQSCECAQYSRARAGRSGGSAPPIIEAWPTAARNRAS